MKANNDFKLTLTFAAPSRVAIPNSSYLEQAPVDSKVQDAAQFVIGTPPPTPAPIRQILKLSPTQQDPELRIPFPPHFQVKEPVIANRPSIKSLTLPSQPTQIPVIQTRLRTASAPLPLREAQNMTERLAIQDESLQFENNKRSAERGYRLKDFFIQELLRSTDFEVQELFLRPLLKKLREIVEEEFPRDPATIITPTTTEITTSEPLTSLEIEEKVKTRENEETRIQNHVENLKNELLFADLESKKRRLMQIVIPRATIHTAIEKQQLLKGAFLKEVLRKSAPEETQKRWWNEVLQCKIFEGLEDKTSRIQHISATLTGKRGEEDKRTLLELIPIDPRIIMDYFSQLPLPEAKTIEPSAKQPEDVYFIQEPPQAQIMGPPAPVVRQPLPKPPENDDDEGIFRMDDF